MFLKHPLRPENYRYRMPRTAWQRGRKENRCGAKGGEDHNTVHDLGVCGEEPLENRAGPGTSSCLKTHKISLVFLEKYDSSYLSLYFFHVLLGEGTGLVSLKTCRTWI